MRDLAYRALQVKEEISANEGREPGIAEIAQRLFTGKFGKFNYKIKHDSIPPTIFAIHPNHYKSKSVPPERNWPDQPPGRQYGRSEFRH